MAMDFYEVVRKRRSIRRYLPKKVEEEKLNRILEAARLAPSAANKQPWRFIVVKSKELKGKLRAAYDKDWFIEAPAIIVACADPREAWIRSDGEEYWKVDVAIALEHLVLAAANEGLGTCWIAAFKEEEVKKTLKIPNHVRVVAMTPLGYPAEEKGPVSKRKKLSELIHYEEW